MNKTEFVERVAEKTGKTKAETNQMLTSICETIVEVMQEGEKLQIVGFGTFEVRERCARKGKDPRTGKEITIPASKAPAFKVSKTFKETVNK